jgi:hypothetical protein
MTSANTTTFPVDDLRQLIQQIVKETLEELEKSDLRDDNIPLSEKQAAKELGTQPGTMAVWRSKGKGPAYFRAGKNVRYERSEIRRFKKLNRVGR